MGVSSQALKTWAMIVLALILIVAGFRGSFGSVLAALLIPQDLRETS